MSATNIINWQGEEVFKTLDKILQKEIGHYYFYLDKCLLSSKKNSFSKKLLRDFSNLRGVPFWCIG